MRTGKILGKRMLPLGLLLCFTSGIISGINPIHSYRKHILFIGIILIYSSVGHARSGRNMRSHSGILHKIYYMFGFSIFLSLFNNMELGILLSGLGIVLIGLAGMTWAPRAMTVHGYSFTKLLKWLGFLHCVVFAVSLITKGIQFSGYGGVFHNPNGMGNAAQIFCALILMLYLILLNEGELKGATNIFLLGLLASAVFFSIVSNNRSSFLSVLTNIVIFIMILLKNSINMKSRIVRKSLKVLLMLLMALIILLCFTNVYELFQENILGKFQTKSELGDVTNGRAERWQTILERATMFGNGEYADMSAHNSFLSMLDQYGYIPFITWSLFTIVGVFKSATNVFFKGKGGLYYIPLFAFLTFGERCLTEGNMLSTGMFLAVFSIGILEPPVGVEIRGDIYLRRY